MGLIIQKTSDQIEYMQQAGRVVEEILRSIQAIVRPGVTTAELDAVAAEITKGHGGKASFLGYRGFPATICASLNEQVVHGIPGKRKLRDGDICSIDVGVELNGWHADAARTFFIGKVAPEVKKLVRVTRESFFEGLRYARVGYRLYDISAAIQKYAEKHGYGVVRELTGHGIGRKLHEPPDIPNYKAFGSTRGIRLEQGMTLAIEPMINLGGAAVRVLSDGWTVVTADASPSAHYENTIAITDGDPLLLTLTQEEHGPEVMEND